MRESWKMHEDADYFGVREKFFHWSTDTELSASEISPNLPGPFVCLQFPNSSHTSRGMRAEAAIMRKYLCIKMFMYCTLFSNESWNPGLQKTVIGCIGGIPHPSIKNNQSLLITVQDSSSIQDLFIPILSLLADVQCLYGGNNKPEERASSGRFLVRYDVDVNRQILILIWRFPLVSALSLTRVRRAQECFL